MRSQVTTKRGDAGTTVTIGGEEYPKSHPILECCGDLDTLRAHAALCRLLVLRSDRDDAEELGEFMLWLLHTFFLIGSQCNDPRDKHPEYRKENMGETHLKRMESVQEKYEKLVRLPKQFIVSASNELAAQFDVLCTLARRLERSVVRLKEAVPEFKEGEILAFVNRSSDCIYMLARLLDDGDYLTVDYEVLGE